MENEFSHKTSSDLEEMNEKLRKDVIHSLEPHGARPVSDLSDMTEGERVKWLFWNLHENLDEVRKMEPTLVGHVMSTQLTVCDGQSMWTDKKDMEKRLELNCNWQLLLTYSTYQNERSYEIGEGWVNLCIGDQPPKHPTLQENQKGYLDADHSLYPNQLFLNGWISEGLWQEIKPQLYSPSPASRTDILLLDNFMFPVKKGFDFVTGPAGAIGVTNAEFRAFSHPTDRRMTRRGEPRQRT
ncbi:MAG: hypothetical protein JWQ21_1331 [Herminiimonas sp.]|jgi:hypothetical protein|nr:hypothetical protein [Herminiimonas sp.]